MGKQKARVTSRPFESGPQLVAMPAKRSGPFTPAAALAAVTFAALVIAFVLYRSALDAPFLFDDIGLPFYQPTFPHESLRAWLTGVRPMLMLTYWLNFQASGREPWSYHALNLVLHTVNTTLVFILVSRILRIQAVSETRTLFCAAFAAGVFLIHPLQTETVAYIAGRSELVCAFFVLTALVIFCDPARETIRWKTALTLLVLYGCAVLSKEQAAVLPVLFVALDMILRRFSIRQALVSGIRLYIPLTLAGILAVASVGYVLAHSQSAGLNVAGMQWYEYFFTQFRVWLLYLRLAVLPLQQNADYDLPLSHTLAEHGAGIAAAVLAVGAILVIRFRQRYQLLACGCVIFAVLLAPTSSLIPIRDLAAERRMYLPLAGLLIASLQLLTRVRFTATVVTGLITWTFLCTALSSERVHVWSSDINLWKDVTRTSPGNVRAHTQLMYAYFRAGRCREAVTAGQSSPAKAHQDAMFLALLGQAFACDRRLPEAVDALERAVLTSPSVGRMLVLTNLYRQSGRAADADATENAAFRMEPRTPYDMTMLQAAHDNRQNSSRARGALRR